MARNFRYYQKKRGNRRTGSPALGSVGEAVFWAVFLLLGCGGTVLVFSVFLVPEWRVDHEFVETTCKVLDKRISEKQGEDGPLYRPEIKIEYEVDGVVHREWCYDIHRAYSSGKKNAEEAIAPFKLYDRAADSLYPCWYDPMNPGMAVLLQGYRWWIWLVFTVPVSFVVIGAGGLIYALLHWGKSLEHRAAMVQRAGGRDFFGVNAHQQGDYPFVPRGVDMTNSPGTRLRFRLPMASSPGWALFGTLAFCILWNGLVSVFVVIAVRSHLAGDPEWFLTFFIIPFVLVGFGAIAMFFRQLLITTGIGPMLLEISDHPLHPGGSYRLFLSQSGRLTINVLRVSLVCEELATYRQGTNTRTETREVYRHQLFYSEGFQIESGLPFEQDIDLEVPGRAMHSFKADHNEINWTLAVEGDVARWPDFKRRFSIVVRPANEEGNR